MSPANEREFHKLCEHLRRVIEAAESRPRGGDHVELSVSWDGKGLVRGRVRGPLDLAESS